MGSPLRDRYMARFKVPMCDDPVFRAWCKLCNLEPGDSVDRDDPRVAQLDQMINPCQDPNDIDEDYLTRGI